MKQVSIVGFGRFGKVLYKLMKDDFVITIYDKDRKAYKKTKLNKEDKIVKKIKDIYESQVIFYAVPIVFFEKVIKEHKKYFKNHLLIDVLSVKEHPEEIFNKYLKSTEARALLTHPLFGPDSSQRGFSGLPMVIDKLTSSEKEYKFWKEYFFKKGIKVVELSAEDHDRMAASSQGIAHFIGRLLSEMNLQSTPIDTLGARKLHEIMEQTCHDTWQLFLNLQNYNRYTKKMRTQFGKAYDKLHNNLLPKRLSKEYIVYGIQGGRGSFNEEAISNYVQKHKIKNYKIKYLYTSHKVLKNLYEGNVDFGLFAIHNSIGGIVEESIRAMADYKFHIVEEFAILIGHFLMKRRDGDAKKINTIMSHPQVLKQCRDTLREKYSKMKLVSGLGDLIDTAQAARALSENRLSANTAILGPKGLSTLYKLKIIAENLQDNKKNYTSFLLVKR